MNYRFRSTGDADGDHLLAVQIERQERRLAEGQCPNGCGPMVRDDVLGYEARCPGCRFHVESNFPEWAFLSPPAPPTTG